MLPKDLFPYPSLRQKLYDGLHKYASLDDPGHIDGRTLEVGLGNPCALHVCQTLSKVFQQPIELPLGSEEIQARASALLYLKIVGIALVMVRRRVYSRVN